jgi:chorismate mutase
MVGDIISGLMPQVDAVDAALVDLLKQRFALSREIGDLKARSGQAPFDPTRVQSQIARFVDRCAEAGLNPWMGQQVISTIVGQVIVERFSILTPPTDSDREET